MPVLRLVIAVAATLSLLPVDATRAATASMSLSVRGDPAIQGRWPGVTAAVDSDQDYDVYIKTRAAGGAACAATPADDPGVPHLTFPAIPAGPGFTSPLLNDDPLPVGRQLLCGWVEPSGADQSAAPLAAAAREVDVIPATVSLVVHAPASIPPAVSGFPTAHLSVDWASNTPGELWLTEQQPPDSGCAADRAGLPALAGDLAGSGYAPFERVGPGAVDVDTPISGTFKTDYTFTNGQHRLCAWIQQIVPAGDPPADPQRTPVLFGPVGVLVDQLVPLHYAGRTSQHRRIVFDIAQNTVIHMDAVVAERCTSGLRHITPSVGFVTVKLHNGKGRRRFHQGTETDRIAITVHGRRARGTFRLKTRGSTGSCDSGPVRFSARRR